MEKKKKCRGLGLAKLSGCGTETILHPMRKGLCFHCWRVWLSTTEDGSEYIKKMSIKTKKDIKHLQAKQKTKGLRDIMSVDAYRAKVLQPVINEIARIIDYGQPCIATGRTTGKMAGGHRKSVGTNRGIALNLHNVHIQSFESNSFRGGDERAYDQGILVNYGKDYLDYLISIENHTSKFAKYELENAYKLACEFRNKLKKEKNILDAESRINKRKEGNLCIGLYNDLENKLK